MNKILFIDSTVTKDSRTKRLAKHLLSRLDGSVEHIVLKDSELSSLDEEMLDFRTECCLKNCFDDKYFDLAKQFAAADTIVIAAPLWDYSFPAVLKKYIENICIVGITFYYSEEGIPIGLCSAKKLYYVTTVGGDFFDEAFGYGYVKGLAEQMFGIKETYLIKATGLDIIGADIEGIMKTAEEDADKLV